MKPEYIHTLRTGATRTAVISATLTPHEGLHVLCNEGETAEQAAARFAAECRQKAARLTRWAERCEAAALNRYSDTYATS